jgi:hypothetical protein
VLDGEGPELILGLRIERAATRDDDRLLGGLEGGDGGSKLLLVRAGAARRPHLLLEHGGRIVIGLGLDILAESEGHRAAIGRVGQDGHGAGERRDDLLGPGDAVEIARDRAEAVVRGHGAVGKDLDLLQHRVGSAVGEDVAR